MVSFYVGTVLAMCCWKMEEQALPIIRVRGDGLEKYRLFNHRESNVQGRYAI